MQISLISSHSHIKFFLWIFVTTTVLFNYNLWKSKWTLALCFMYECANQLIILQCSRIKYKSRAGFSLPVAASWKNSITCSEGRLYLCNSSGNLSKVRFLNGVFLSLEKKNSTFKDKIAIFQDEHLREEYLGSSRRRMYVFRSLRLCILKLVILQLSINFFLALALYIYVYKKS